MKQGRYPSLGSLIIELRQKSGITEQSGLARLVNSTQQTVSRWELGLARPGPKKIPLIAKALGIDQDTLFREAGYMKEASHIKKMVSGSISFSRPFPLAELSPENFERFCFYFLNFLYGEQKDVKVHRVELGHRQQGVDIDIIFPNRTIYTFQCKRVQNFGPAMVFAAMGSTPGLQIKKFY